MEEGVLEDYVANNLSRLLPGLERISRHKRIARGRQVDIYAKDAEGKEYYIEVKSTQCNRVNIGEIVEYKAHLMKVNPKAKMVLICRDVDISIKETLRDLGIEIYIFGDLGIPEKLVDSVSNKSSVLKLSPTEQEAYFALLRRGVTIARTEELASIINVSKSWAKNILANLARRGVAQRIGIGKYVIIPAEIVHGRQSYVIDPLVLVSELMEDQAYYVAYQSAAHIHGIADQLPFRTNVAVLKQKRSVNVGNIKVDFITLKNLKFFGFEETKYSDVFLNVSDLEKTVIDCVDRQNLCGGIMEVTRTLSNAVSTEKLDWKKLVSYVRKFRSYALTQRLGFLLERLNIVKEIWVEPTFLDELSQLTSSYTYLLNTKAPKEGKISKRWKIIENTRIFET